VEDYGIAAPYKFTGKIAKVTVDIKAMEPAGRAAAAAANAQAALKKAVSD
jgi:hypothetical protein